MSANGISTLATKAERQLAKLQAASVKRAATGRRSALDITQLPTVYAPGDNNTNDVINNPNIGGLIEGRPWVTGGMVEGQIWRNVYSGVDTNNMPDIANLISSGPVDDIWTDSIPVNTTYEYTGYFRANWSGLWTFNIRVDDVAWFWIGPQAILNTQLGNAQIAIGSVGADTCTVPLEEGNLYPFRLVCGNGGGAGYVEFEWWNDLTLSRVLSLDAAIQPENHAIMGNTDEFNYPGVGLLGGSGISKSTEHGGIIKFDGTAKAGSGGGFVLLDQNFVADFTGGISISIWANISTGSGPWGRLIDFGNGPANYNFLIAVYGENPTELIYEAYNGATSGTGQPVLSAIPFDQWKLYTLTGDGTNYYWYINDQLVNTLTGVSFLPPSGTRNSYYCRIGGSDWEADWNLKGAIASVEIYNRALSIDEITGLFNERKGKFGL